MIYLKKFVEIRNMYPIILNIVKIIRDSLNYPMAPIPIIFNNNMESSIFKKYSFSVSHRRNKNMNLDEFLQSLLTKIYEKAIKIRKKIT